MDGFVRGSPFVKKIKPFFTDNLSDTSRWFLCHGRITIRLLFEQRKGTGCILITGKIAWRLGVLSIGLLFCLPLLG